MTDTRLRIRASVARYLNVAFHQNAIPAIHEIAVENLLDTDLTDVEVGLVSDPGFARPLVIRIERIAAGGVHHVRNPDLRLEAGFLRTLTEGLRGSIEVRAAIGGQPVATEVVELQLHPPSHWGGVGAVPDLLAAYVRPNDTAVDAVLRDAAERLTAAGRPSAIDGYRSGRKERVWEVAAALWSALAARGIAYVLPPASFERTGQKVRAPGDILERRLGTCLDTTLFLAACLEQAGLRPVVVLTAGHAFLGLWLKEEGFSAAVVDDVQVLRKRRDLEDMIFIETTLLTGTPPARFSHAVEQGNRQLAEDAAAPLELAIDVCRARARGIRPLDLAETSATARPLAPETNIALEIDEAPAFVEDVVVREDQAGATVDRLEHWKRKLLDLTLRNKLLNFKDTKKAVSIECPAPARFEDMLAAGERFRLLGQSDVLDEGDRRDARLFELQRQDDGRRHFLLDALERKELHTDVTEKELDARLTDLYRLTRTAFEEGGSNILFIASGFLKWSAKEGGPFCRAPLILIPASLQRSSVRAGFRLALHEEEPRFNPTLLQMLRQDFALRMPDIERELPSDENGLDIDQILRIVRTHVRDLKGWEVTPEIVLSTFSFTKFLMWRDLVDRTDLLKRSPVVRHLIDTPKHTYGDGSPFPGPQTIDRERPADLFAPLSADSSQLSAVLAAAAGKDFVLFGPPGTGKSQTIANMISHCLALGKTVLFVSQKTAALEVVQRRLKEIGLGEYCLEVHSTKAQKSEVLRQLKAAWHERAAPDAAEWDLATGELAALRDELNALVEALHRRRPNGLSAYQGFSRVVSTLALLGDIRLDWGTRSHSEEDRAELAEIVRRLRTDLAPIGLPSGHPLDGLQVRSWTPAWRAALIEAGRRLAGAIAGLADLPERYGRLIGIRVGSDATFVDVLRRLGALLADPAARLGNRLLGADGRPMEAAAAAIETLRQRAAEPERRLSTGYTPSIYREDLEAMRSEWTAACESNFLMRSGRQKKVRDKLQPFAEGTVGDDVGRELLALIELAALRVEADAAAAPLVAIGLRADGLMTDLAPIRAAQAWVGNIRRTAAELAALLGIERTAMLDHVGLLLRDYADRLAPDGDAGVAYEHFAAALDEVEKAAAVMAPLAGRAAMAEAGRSWAETAGRVERWLGAMGRIQDWCHWQETSATAREKGLGPLVDAVEDGRVRREDLESVFEGAYALWWIEGVVTEDPVLRAFSVTRQEDAIERFRAADARVAELTKRVVRARLKGDIPAPNAFGNDREWGMLASELTRRVRQKPLRQLFAAIPTVLTRLTPCVMMSPLSIAQYLPADGRPFDLVIFDEASQIPVWDAIGAIARGRQVVIVGDPEQLPPTNVGERGIDDVEDGTDVEDQESILSECLAANIPSRHLLWHYRSRHESLIAFSNQEYYAGKLVTFPSPVTEDRAVRHVPVPKGLYERGKGRVNREEARAVVAETVRRLGDPDFERRRSSLGIVTFNGEQQRLIENLLDQERRGRPEIEPFFDPLRWHEPVFVKNLENVQGDERDSILFSVAVTPDEARGSVATISSLNKDGGHRRLNVAITRAREEMVVFATLRPDQVDLSRTRSRGVRDFKHFLEFAERGPRALAEAFAPTGGGTESPFEDAVKASLEARGWIVHTQIGVSGFRIDLGVVDPDWPGRYLAGVECDGATYHRSATARDRDRLREQVLTRLGWRIRRVWSADWWMDAQEALERLHERLLRDLEESRAAEQAARPQDEGGSAIAPLPAEDWPPLSEAPVAPVVELAEDAAPTFGLEPAPPADALHASAAYAAAPPPAVTVTEGAYRVVDLAAAGFPADPDRFYEPGHRPVVLAMIGHIIAVEGPIYEDLLVQRIARAHGFARAASRIRETVLLAADGRYPRSMDDDRVLFWPEDHDMTAPVPFRGAAPGRDHVDIPIVELATLAARYLGEGADADEAVRRVAQHLELGRLRGTTRDRLARAVAHALRGRG